MAGPTREHQILTEIAMGRFSTQRGKDATFEQDAEILLSLDKRGFVAPPFTVHCESQTAAGNIDFIQAVKLTPAGREYLERLKRGA